MTIAKRLKQHLEDQGVTYELVSHPRTESSSRTAQAAHISGERVAKSVVVHHGDSYVLAVVPSTHRVELDSLKALLDKPLGLATESEIAELFDDCDLGAVPPVGAAYGLPVLLDESLADVDQVYFEGGDHTTLVQVAGDAFESLMADARRGRFSHHI